MPSTLKNPGQVEMYPRNKQAGEQVSGDEKENINQNKINLSFP
jgi:hypothetical protein